jgi:hypothetical protein
MNVPAIGRRSGKILIAFVILWMAYALGLHRGFTSPAKRFIEGVDGADSKVTQKETSYEYDPYFTRVNFTNANPIPAKVK